jgi:hypothetical protein
MVIHSCIRCGYSTRFKTSLTKHMVKKKPCIANNILSSIVDKQNLSKDQLHVCKCGKKYSHISSLSRHSKLCEIYQEHKYIITSMHRLEKEVADIKKNDNHVITTNNLNSNNNNNNNSNNNNNNTMNNTIVVNNFGHEDISHLSPQFLEKCLFYMSMGVKSLTHVIHLDKNKPENHTIKVTNIKSPFVSVIKDGKWIYKDKDEALSELISKENDILKSHYEENEVDMKRKWTEHKLEVVKRWLDRLDDEDKELWMRLKKEIFLILVNNRDVLMEKMVS